MDSFLIDTERLILKPVHPDMSETITEIRLDTFDTLHQTMSICQYKPTVDQIRGDLQGLRNEMLANNGISAVIWLKNEQRYIGMCGALPNKMDQPEFKSVKPWDIWYWMHKNYEDKGYMTEAVKSMMNYMHTNQKVNCFVIFCLANNEKSARVAERLKFKYLYTKEVPPPRPRSDWPDKVLEKFFIFNFPDQ